MHFNDFNHTNRTKILRKNLKNFLALLYILLLAYFSDIHFSIIHCNLQIDEEQKMRKTSQNIKYESDI